MEETQAIFSAVTGVVRCLVPTPEAVSVNVVESARGVVLRVAVPANELGAVIGKRGRTAKSLRILVHAINMNCKQNLSLDIVSLPEQPPSAEKAG